MLASLPAVGRKVLLAHRERLVIERRRKGIVPSVEESELRDHCDDLDDLDDLAVTPMLAQFRDHLIGNAVRYVAGSERHVERADFRPALHDEYPVRDEAAAGGVEDRKGLLFVKVTSTPLAGIFAGSF